MGRGMKAGKKAKVGGMGGGNMQKQLQQMQALQKQMASMQAELEEKEFTATVGGGVVSVTANGAKEITKVTIDKAIVDPDDVETLEDMVMVAVNEVLRQVDEVTGDEMSKLTGGLGIPGLM